MKILAVDCFPYELSLSRFFLGNFFFIKMVIVLLMLDLGGIICFQAFEIVEVVAYSGVKFVKPLDEPEFSYSKK